jgi:hypothetical protein
MPVVRLAACASLLAFAACGQLPPPPPEDGGTTVEDAGFSDGGLDLNDVSWLFPLPAPAQRSQLLSLESAGAKGPLLPRALYDGLPPLVENEPNADVFADLAVVSARIDPCFPATATGGCIKQLRLVVQPVRLEQLQVTTADATLHLFYELSDAEFEFARQTVLDLKAIAGSSTQRLPLDVHPVMKAQGLAGPYAVKLKGLILATCGAQNLTRVAFMQLVQLDVAWNFGAFDVREAALVADPIPRLSERTLQGVQEFGSTDFRNGTLQPAPSGDLLDVLLSESELRLTDQRTYDRALTSALRLEHPARTSPKTADCGSCHVVSRALRNARGERPADLGSHADRYVGNPRFDLRRVDAVGDDPRALRAFGYFGRQSALSQRTIHESADVAEALSR